MKLVHYSNDNGEIEFVVGMAETDEVMDYCENGISISSITIVPDITGFPMQYKLIREGSTPTSVEG